MFVKYGALKSIKIKEDKKNTVAEQGSDYGREIPESLFPSPLAAREGEHESAAEYRSRHNRLSKFLDG